MNPVSSRILCAALLLAAFTPTIAQEPFPGFPMFPANHKRMPGEQVKLTAKSAWRFLNPLDGTDPAAGVKDFHSSWTKLTFDDSKWENHLWFRRVWKTYRHFAIRGLRGFRCRNSGER